MLLFHSMLSDPRSEKNTYLITRTLTYSVNKQENACADPEVRSTAPTPLLKNDKNLGFLSNTGLDPL